MTRQWGPIKTHGFSEKKVLREILLNGDRQRLDDVIVIVRDDHRKSNQHDNADLRDPFPDSKAQVPSNQGFQEEEMGSHLSYF